MSFTASGLPPGVTASFSPTNTSFSSVLTLTAAATATPGTATVSVNGISGSLTHSVTISLTINAVVPRTVAVDLSSFFNVTAIYTDGTTFPSNGGVTFGEVFPFGEAYSATLLGQSLVVNGTVFAFGQPNLPNAVTSKAVPLSAGQFGQLQMLAVSPVDQPPQVFTVTYTDGTRTSFLQGLSGIAAPPFHYEGESVAAATGYGVTSDGGKNFYPLNLYRYSFNIDESKTVSSFALPNNPIVIVLAVTLSAGVPGAAPEITSTVNGASFQPGLAPGAWVTLMGTHLAATTRPWASQEIVNGALPAQLDGVSVSLGGYPAAVSYISPVQLNVQVPTEARLGTPLTLLVTAPQGSASTFVTVRSTAPGLFSFDGKYAAAQHADYTPVGKDGLYPSSTPARPGESIVLYGTGFGPTTPPVPARQTVSEPAPMVTAPSFRIGGQLAAVSFAGIVGAGLYQFNVTIPSGLADGDAAVVATDTGVTTQSGLYIAIQN